MVMIALCSCGPTKLPTPSPSPAEPVYFRSPPRVSKPPLRLAPTEPVQLVPPASLDERLEAVQRRLQRLGAGDTSEQ